MLCPQLAAKYYIRLSNVEMLFCARLYCQRNVYSVSQGWLNITVFKVLLVPSN